MNINIIIKKDEDMDGFIANIKNVNKKICVGKGKTEIEAVKDVINVYEKLIKIYNNDSFNRELVWKDNAIVQLRNGDKYRLKDTKGILIKQKTDDNTCIKELYCYCYDSYLYYGINAQYDIIKIFDENNNILAEREHYNELDTANFVRM
ncbi:TPA: hypothetical protein ACXDAY_002284 [Clostridium botulinum]|uniref:hypothetical protein n=1 Tax=Clostridium botulinum TaxID=1491 RepID=UPI00046416C3|nr:hypothetical protein [Clostridium botulinum]APH20940.1 hypothetical protein NPD1_4090 [Clostridium botulinum]APQ71282.1 hypothetical protein RSJ8_4326 [Clostridium botulinum]APR02319.1 hypothetical protein RSJ2_4187 [Clostridium botulinum]MBN3352014.1 hypothetical protein [Clostridium botulinum]MBN3359157.1 hypothetical protein [Clostridium botulinum]